MYLHTGSMELESNSSIDGNAAGDDGGGLSAWKSTLTASNISIDGNAAGDIGGGVYALSCSSITLSQGASANSRVEHSRRSSRRVVHAGEYPHGIEQLH